MKSKLSPIIVFFLIILNALSACQTTQFAEGNDIPVSGKDVLWQPLAEKPTSYLQKAQNAEPAEKESYKLYAVQSMLQNGDVTQGQQLLSTIQVEDKSIVLKTRKTLLEAYVQLIDNKTNRAIHTLNKTEDTRSLPLTLQIQFHKLLASAYARAGKHFSSIKQRLILDNYLKNSNMQMYNQRAMWDELHQMKNETLALRQSQALAKGNTQLAGWLNLAYIEKFYAHDQKQLYDNINQWKDQYPYHPAQKMLPVNLVTPMSQVPSSGDHIVLMLPMHGRLAKAGHAVRDGFMSAYYGKSKQQEVRVIDTSSSYDIVGLYNKAVKDGATFVVGPLNKRNVETLSSYHALTVPTLALNYSRSTFVNNLNLYQFGLSPLDEAKQAAAKAWDEKHSRAIIITPKGKWGKEVANAFSKRFHALGGIVVDELQYARNKKIANDIKHLLQVDESADRAREVAQEIKSRVDFVPRRRQDFDMIFLVANPRKAQQIRPLLKFYYAGDVNIYATSSIYSGIPSHRINHDLDGIIFSDIPYVLNNSSDATAKRKHLAHLWPNQFNHYVRLYALGMDAYSLSQKLNQLRDISSFRIPGATGYLTLGNDQRIQRSLGWAYMRNGMPVAIDQG